MGPHTGRAGGRCGRDPRRSDRRERAGSGDTPLPGVTNYVLGEDPAGWLAGVPSFGRVRYDEVYPGIDLEYYGVGGDLEYDWLVAPGADPRLIALQFSGNTGLDLSDTGDLVIHTAAGDFVQRAPVLHQEIGQERVLVSGRYDIAESGAVGFAVGDYDPSRPLIIDPVLGYSTYLGGSGGEAITGVAADDAGNTYVIGTTMSATLSGQATGAAGLYGRAFVTKFDAAGQIQYTTLLGPATRIDATGYAHSHGDAIAVGPDGLPRVAFVSAEGAAISLASGGLQPLPAPARLHVAKLSSEGLPVFDAVQSDFTADGLGDFQSFNGIAASGITVDAAGAAYAAFSAIHPRGEILDYVTKVTNVGAEDFVKQLFVSPRDIAVDEEGSIYLVATTSSADLPVSPGAFQ